jgi:hypothetical protein
MSLPIFPAFAPKAILAAAILFVSLGLISLSALADSPFIDQIPGGLTSAQPLGLLGGDNQHSAATPTAFPAPQFALPHNSSGNLASSVEIGNGNHISQVQTGVGDESGVGIIGGNSNNVGVVQAGNGLQSNLLMIGAKGMNVSILQPSGSAPVNMAIIRAPSATIIIPR